MRGFTLIELMVVVVIVALVVLGAALGLGATDAAKLQKSAWAMVAASRYAYSHAVANDVTVRLVMDFSQRTIHLEETDGRVVLSRDDRAGEGLPQGDTEGATPDTDNDTGISLGAGQDTGDAVALTDPFLVNLRQALGATVGYRPPAFSPLEGRKGRPRRLAGTVRFVRVYSPHAPEPIEDGKAHIYYFPRGMTEHTFVVLDDGDERDPQVATVEIEPVTGRTTVYYEEREPPEDLEPVEDPS